MIKTKATAKTKTKAASRYFEAVGRRKTSVARVRITPASKNSILINERTLENYFPSVDLQQAALEPVAVLETKPKLAISVKVTGGGVASQAGAIAHGLARAIIIQDISLRPFLKKRKFLRRDPRAKERRKFGLKKARKSPQWSKR